MAHSKTVDIRNRRSGEVLRRGARWGDAYFSRLRGLMFRRGLAEGEALILVEAADSRTTTSIHMFFVPFAIAAIWIDSRGRVVDKALAKPWRPFYAPRAPARYVLEAAPELLDKVAIGDELAFEDSAPA